MDEVWTRFLLHKRKKYGRILPLSDEKKIKNDFSTRRLDIWNMSTFLRREPNWNFGAFAVKNRLCAINYRQKR